MIIRPPTPAERLMAAVLYDEWDNPEPFDSFNMVISNAAARCGVSYERMEWIAGRAIFNAGQTFPAFGRNWNAR
jgi:hypothetical protein